MIGGQLSKGVLAAATAVLLSAPGAWAQQPAAASSPAGEAAQPSSATLPPVTAAPPAAATPVPSSSPAEAAPQPLTPEDLEQLRRTLVNQNKAVILNRGEMGQVRDRAMDGQAALAYPGYSKQRLPTARRREIAYNQAPTAQPEHLALWQGTITALSFIDKNGRPWPIADVAYDPRLYSVNGQGCGENREAPPAQQEGEDRPNTLNVMPCAFWSWANLVVSLEGMAVPMVIQTQSGTEENGSDLDMAVTVRVNGTSPARSRQPNQLVAAADPRLSGRDTGFKPDNVLDDFLNGTPPKAARHIRVAGDATAEGWVYNGSLYLRGNFVVMNPAHDARASFGDYQVWRFNQPTSRILVKSSDGTEQALVVDY